MSVVFTFQLGWITQSLQMKQFCFVTFGQSQGSRLPIFSFYAKLS